MAFQLKEAALPPPTLGISEGSSEVGSSRRSRAKPDAGSLRNKTLVWNLLTCLRCCKERPDRTASQRSPPLLPLPAFWREPTIVGNCHDNNNDDKDDVESVRGESAATQRSAGKRPTGVSTDAGGLIEGQ